MIRSRIRRQGHIAVFLLVLGLVAAACGSPGGDDSSDTIKIGWLSSLTGPLSAAAKGENRGVEYAVKQLNAKGGIDGKKIKLVVRDTQGDPTKAVNAANELTRKEKVDFIIGPVNSGEALPAVPVVAKSDTPNIIIGTIDSLTDPKKYPMAFRTIPTNAQWVTAATNYLVDNLDVKKVAILGDTTGYGTGTVDQAVDLVKKSGGTVSYRGLIDPAQTDVTSDIRKAKAAGADAIMVWSAAAGLDGRIINARSALKWDVPIVGHPALASGDTGKLLDDRSNWEKVYAVGYRSMSRDAAGHLPKRTEDFVKAAGPKVLGSSIDYTLWWVTLGYDSVQTIKHAIDQAGSTKPEDIKKALASTKDLEGVFGTYSWATDDRDGFPLESVVMNEASSFKEGTFTLAPGYE